MRETQFDFILPAGRRLDIFLTESLREHGENVSRSELQRLIAKNCVSGLDAEATKPSFKAKAPTAIRITLPQKKEKRLVPLSANIPVLYEDNFLALVHKPASMTVHPGANTGDDTLVHALLGQIDRLAEDVERPGIVHRLDRETEGVMVVAKTERARSALSALFAERKVKKTYRALVWGRVTFPEEVDGFIGRDRRNRKKMRFYPQESETVGFVREASMRIVSQTQLKFATELIIELITGRTHQIRAVCTHYNAPLVGDALYGSDAAKFRLYKIGRERRKTIEKGGMCLIAESIRFDHPLKRKKISFSISLPQRFNDVQIALS